MDYWEEAVRVGLEENNIQATEEQILGMIETVKGAFDNYGMAHGHDVIFKGAKTNAEVELENIITEEEKRRAWIASTIGCKTCHGDGTIIGGWGRTIICPKCDGKGRINRR